MWARSFFNPLSANPTKWLNTFKQFVGKLPTNCLSVFSHFVGLMLKGLKSKTSWRYKIYWIFEKSWTTVGLIIKLLIHSVEKVDMDRFVSKFLSWSPILEHNLVKNNIKCSKQATDNERQNNYKTRVYVGFLLCWQCN